MNVVLIIKYSSTVMEGKRKLCGCQTKFFVVVAVVNLTFLKVTIFFDPKSTIMQGKRKLCECLAKFFVLVVVVNLTFLKLTIRWINKPYISFFLKVLLKATSIFEIESDPESNDKLKFFL